MSGSRFCIALKAGGDVNRMGCVFFWVVQRARSLQSKSTLFIVLNNACIDEKLIKFSTRLCTSIDMHNVQFVRLASFSPEHENVNYFVNLGLRRCRA